MLFALALLLTQTPQPRLFLQPNLSHRRSASHACAQSIECAISASDKSGNWYALETDGTMLSGSSLTMTATSSPGVSPLDFTAGGYFVSGAVAFPSTDFSLVAVVNVSSCAGALKVIVGNLNGTNYSWLLSCVTNTIELDMHASGGGFGTAAHSPTTNAWIVCGLTYTTATGATKLRCEGTNHTATAAGGGFFSLGGNRAHSIGGATNGTTPWSTGKSRGVFYTEKILSDADIDRIGAGAL